MAVQFSLQQPSSPRSPPLSEVTNTVNITSLPKSFFNPLILDLLQSHFTKHGEINQWVPLPGFGRIIVVYEKDESAERAKLRSDPIIIEASHEYEEVQVRVFRADRNLLKDRNAYENDRNPYIKYLQPPKVEKNFLISPPGSPPVGWEQLAEDPPNSAPLASDLISALRKIKIQEEQEEQGQFAMLLHPSEAGVGVYVEDCDASGALEVHEDDWVYGETMPTQERWRPVATALPPMRAVSA